MALILCMVSTTVNLILIMIRFVLSVIRGIHLFGSTSSCDDLILVWCVITPGSWFSKVLYSSTQGAGTKKVIYSLQYSDNIIHDT